MALFLTEHQMGFDTQRIGFPGLGGCMAVALLTQGGIYGFHFTPATEEQIKVFGTFMKRQRLFSGIPDDAVHLYGSCRFSKRFSAGDATQQWEVQMTAIAGALGYHGKVTGCNLSKVGHGEADDAPNASMYLEYLCSAGATDCTIQYKRQSKMDLSKPPEGSTGAMLGPVQGVQKAQWSGGPGGKFTVADPKGALVSGATLKARDEPGPARKMRTPNETSMVSFTV